MPSVDELAPIFFAAIKRIPYGNVATYGQVARIAGFPKHSRHVGRALGNMPADSDVPWFRVVNSRGEIAARVLSHHDGKVEDSESEQRRLLSEEGIEFDNNNRIRMSEFQWDES